MLKRCLTSIFEEFAVNGGDDFVVVVENDTSPKSARVVEDLSRTFPEVPVHYELETEPGIPFARNRTLDIARRKGADWIAFIDDDEKVRPGWLDAMRRAAQSLGAQALTGPVVRICAHEEPAWLKANGGKPRQHGQVLERAATNNTLVDLRWLAAQQELLRFDERLRYTGGSDTEFFYRFVKCGGVIKWVSDAEVTEEVPAARMTMRWQVNRKTRTQANNVRLYRIHNGFSRAAARYVPAAVRRIVLRGVPSCAAAVFMRPISKQRSDQIWFYGRRTIGSGVGALFGLFDRELEPYRVIEGE